ncbi:MAG: NAD(P)H-dependent amine dehydrogenase family protein [Candidatus Hodarchaeales archaeon]
MSEFKFNVIQVGFGPMGRLVAKLLLNRKNIDLLGIVDIDPGLKGKKIGSILKDDTVPDLEIQSSLEGLIKKGVVDIMVIATSSSLEKIFPLIKLAATNGINVLSLCEQLSYPFLKFPDLSKEIDTLAKKNDITVLGTGINPGYLMDLLPIVVTAPTQKVDKITVVRMMNSAKRRGPFQKKIGTGLNVKEFTDEINNKEITGHVGLEESIGMIISALGLEFDQIKEYPPEAVIAEEKIVTPYTTVEKGQVCGLKSIATATRSNREIVRLEFIAYAGEHDEYDEITIEGIPKLHQKIIGGVHGDIGTAAMVANLIPNVCSARTGLVTMKDIPVPRNTENIFKT